MSKWLASSAPPPRKALALMSGGLAGCFATAYWLPQVSASCGCVAVGAGIYAFSRFMRRRYLVVGVRREVLPADVLQPLRPALEEPTPMIIESNPLPPIRVKAYTVEPRQRELTANRRELPGADQRPVLRR